MKITIDEKLQQIPYYPKAMMYGFEDGWTILSSNENPFPPSKKVFSTLLESLPAISRYPGGEAELKSAIASLHDLSPGQVVIGNGSNELIELSLKALKNDRQNGVVISESSFAFYDIAAKIYGYEVKKAPMNGMYVDLEAIRGLVDEKTRVIFVNNPLNPTGTIFEAKAFDSFVRSLPEDILVVVDEAYGEFAESPVFPKSLEYISDFPVVVLRTFSKAYGLAGLRVGYGIGQVAVMSFMERTKQPFSVNMVALIAARAALSDTDYLKRVLQNNSREKQIYYKTLKEKSVEYVPTEANFILIKLGKQAEQITKKLFEKKILVRFMGAYNLPEYIRVTIGTPEENQRFMDALMRAL